MKIYILADMEGISGIRKIEEVQADQQQEYNYGKSLMIKDLNAAIDGCFKGGATEVVAADTHFGGGQLDMHLMDDRACYEIPNKGLIMPSLDETFDGVILLGHHAKAGTIDSFLDHTMSSTTWFDYRLNDISMGEIGIEAAWAGHYKVPIIMVSGDEATAHEAGALLGDVETAVVKWAVGRNRAKCLSLKNAHDLITNTAERAVMRAADFSAFTPDLPCRIELTFYRSDVADTYSGRAGIQRIDARTIGKTVHSLLDFVITR